MLRALERGVLNCRQFALAQGGGARGNHQIFAPANERRDTATPGSISAIFCNGVVVLAKQLLVLVKFSAVAVVDTNRPFLLLGGVFRGLHA